MTQRWLQVLVAAAVAGAYLGGALEIFDRAAMDLRFRLLDRPASQELVLIEIDPRSLRELEVWPWPRSHHAVVLRRLSAAGAGQIALDIDFSSHSTDAADRALAQALAGAEPPVLLPAFTQFSVEPSGVVRTFFAQPVPEFSAHGRLSSVNVRPDPDGLVRRIAMAYEWQDTILLSMSADLAETRGTPDDIYYIDFGIDPLSIPRVSFVDVLRNDFDPSTVAGKDVIIGPTAVELGDHKSVPIHKALSGPVIQALAFESLVQGRAIQRLGGMLVVIVGLALALALGRPLSRMTWRTGLGMTVGCTVAIFLVTLGVQAVAPVSLDIAPLGAILFLSYAANALLRIDQLDLRVVIQRAQINRQNAFMRSVVEHSFDGIVTVDEAGVITSFNKSAEQIFGCTESESIGRDLRLFVLPGPDGPGQLDVPKALTIRTEPVEMVGRRRGGEVFPIDFVVSPIPNGDRPQYVVLVRDITARKEAEERARKAQVQLIEAIESTSDGFVLYDAEDRLVLCNTRAPALFPGAVELLTPGRRFEETVRAMVESSQVPEAVPDPEEWIRWRLDQHRRIQTVFQMRLADERWLRVSESRTLEGGVVSVVSDITEMKDREAALETAKVRSELANRAKSEFLTSISHELRTPLNAIIGFSEMMKTEAVGPIGERYKDYATDIYESGSHLLALINDILDLSKVESGEDELCEESIDISAAVGSALKMVKQHADKGGIRLEVDVPDRLPRLCGDRRKLHQILVNLLSNGIKFTETGGTVTVTAACDPATGHVVRIADTGIGIAPEDIEKALAPFQQVDSRLARRYEGTGLGLPLTKALVEMHGGSLDLASEVGAGTSVTVRFPATRVEPSASTAA